MKLILVFFIITIILFNKIFLNKINCFQNIITVIWCISLMLSLYGFFDIYIPTNDVVYYSLIFLISLNIFSVFFYKVIKIKKQAKYEYIINHQLLNFILIFCIMMLIFFCRKSISIFFTTFNFDLIRNMFISYKTISEYSQVLIYISAIPMGKACMILSIIEYARTKKMSSTLFLSIIFLLLCSLLTGGRSYLFLVVLIFLVSLYVKNESIMKILKKHKKAIRTILFIIIIIVLITSKRGFGNGGIIKSIYVYFCGSFSLFSTYIKNNLVFDKNLLYGKELLDGFFFPIIEILRYVFGFNILPGNYILAAEATSKYIGISPTIAINASPTVMYFAIRDFNIIGLIIYPFVISYFYVYLKNKSMNGNYLNKAIYIYYVSLCFMLTMSFPFDSFKNVGVFIYLILICGLLKKEKLKE